MSFRLNLSACLKNCCTELSVTDTTGVYPGVSTGWEQDNIYANPISGASISSAIFTAEKIDSDGNVEAIIINGADVLDNYGEVVTGYITYPDMSPDAGGSFTDGLYKLTLTVVDIDGITYTQYIKQFFYCQVKCCVEKMIMDIPSKMCTGCNYDEYVQKVWKAKILLEALKYAAGCADTTTANSLLVNLQDICDFNNCNC